MVANRRLNVAYGYQLNGNISGTTRAGTPVDETVYYTYDEMDRLLSARSTINANAPVNETYGYDTAGNLKSKSVLDNSGYGTGRMDPIFANGFESGTLANWSSSATDGGNLSVSTLAKNQGGYGLQAVINDTTTLYVQDNSPAAEPTYRARFYFNPNNLNMALGDVLTLVSGISNGIDVFSIGIRKTYRLYQININIRTDAGEWLASGWYSLSGMGGWRSIEFEFQAEHLTGQMSFWIDGNLKRILTGADNDGSKIDSLRIGAMNVPATTGGTIYFDDFESRRFTYIGTLSNPGASTPLFSNGFESGNLSGWSGSVIDGGNLSASASAKNQGSYGLQALINDNNTLYVRDDTPATKSTYRARFSFNPNSQTIAAGSAYSIFTGLSGTSYVAALQVQQSGSAYQARLAGYNSGGIWSAPSDISTLPGSGELQNSDGYVIGNTLTQGVWRGGSGYTRTVPIVNGVVQWGQASAWSGPISITTLPGTGDVQTIVEYVVGNTIIQGLWRGNSGYSRTVSIVNGVPQWGAATWSAPMDINTLPGSGDLQSQDGYVYGNTLNQGLWRGGLGYTRTVPIVNNVIQWGQASAWNIPISNYALPGNGNLQTIAEYVVGNTMIQGIWQGSKGYVRTATIVNGAFQWSGTGWTYSDWANLINGWNGIEIEYEAGGFTGHMSLWVGGELKQTLSGLSNSNLKLDTVHLGPESIVDGTRGTIYFDDFESRRYSTTGTLTYKYEDPNHVHAATSVTHPDGTIDTYQYDANGNMIQRKEGGLTYDQVFDAENRLVSVKIQGETYGTEFYYNGDGNMVEVDPPEQGLYLILLRDVREAL